VKKIGSYLLLISFTAVFSYETAEFFLFGKIEKSPAYQGVQELEEDAQGSEESREEKDDELKFNDDFFYESEFRTSLHMSVLFIKSLNRHYISSDYSSKFYSPPELI